MTATSENTLLDQVDRCLPQTQCTLCTYPRCREYAKAITRNEARINQCPPGGEITITALAKLLNKPIVELNTNHGENEPRMVALIREDECIGCKLCIRACPVDCIVGTAKLMHTIIADECTGCKLCVPVCPTDCIDLVEPDFTKNHNSHDTPSPWPGFSVRQVNLARLQTEQKSIRVEKFDSLRKKQKRTLMRNRMRQEILDAVNRKSIQNQSS